jgi:non-homologous end joining protein Ku
MTPQEKCLFIINKLGYNTRQTGEVLKVATQTVDKKMKHTNNNKFTDEDFDKLCEFIDDLKKEISKLN